MRLALSDIALDSESRRSTQSARCGGDDEESFDSTHSLGREKLKISNKQKVYGGSERERHLAAFFCS